MAQGRLNLMDPAIESLLDKVDSKFTLVALGALRARQVNAYYNSLGEGLGRVVPPQVASVSGKPLSIAFEEVAAGKATYVRLDPEELAAAEAAEAAGLEGLGSEGADLALLGLAVDLVADTPDETEGSDVESLAGDEAVSELESVVDTQSDIEGAAEVESLAELDGQSGDESAPDESVSEDEGPAAS